MSLTNKPAHCFVRDVSPQLHHLGWYLLCQHGNEHLAENEQPFRLPPLNKVFYLLITYQSQSHAIGDLLLYHFSYNSKWWALPPNRLKWQQSPTSRSPSALAQSPIQNLWDISEIGQALAHRHYLKDPMARQGPSNMSPRENSASQVCVQLAQERGVTAQFPCGRPERRLVALTYSSNPHSGRKPPRYQHYHLFQVWGMSSNISKQ